MAAYRFDLMLAPVGGGSSFPLPFGFTGSSPGRAGGRHRGGMRVGNSLRVPFKRYVDILIVDILIVDILISALVTLMTSNNAPGERAAREHAARRFGDWSPRQLVDILTVPIRQQRPNVAVDPRPPSSWAYWDYDAFTLRFAGWPFGHVWAQGASRGSRSARQRPPARHTGRKELFCVDRETRVSGRAASRSA